MLSSNLTKTNTISNLVAATANTQVATATPVRAIERLNSNYDSNYNSNYDSTTKSAVERYNESTIDLVNKIVLHHKQYNKLPRSERLNIEKNYILVNENPLVIQHIISNFVDDCKSGHTAINIRDLLELIYKAVTTKKEVFSTIPTHFVDTKVAEYMIGVMRSSGNYVTDWIERIPPSMRTTEFMIEVVKAKKARREDPYWSTEEGIELANKVTIPKSSFKRTLSWRILKDRFG